jgi:hypothetical protein
VNFDDLAQRTHYDERELAELNARFVRIFHRHPSRRELLGFRRSEARLHLRIPAQTRRTIAAMIAGS